MAPSLLSSSPVGSPARLLLAPALLVLLPLSAACGSGDDGNDDADAPAERASEPAMTVESVMPAPARPTATPANTANEGPPAASAPRAPAADSAASDARANAANAQMPAAPAAPTAAFAACTYSEGSYGRNCDSVFVTMKQASPARCVQLTIDNCGTYGRQGIGADLPMGWRLESGTVSSNLNQCELGVYDPSSDVAQRAEGTITWTETTRLPSDLVLDLALQTSAVGAEEESFDIATAGPIPTTTCDR